MKILEIFRQKTPLLIHFLTRYFEKICLFSKTSYPNCILARITKIYKESLLNQDLINKRLISSQLIYSCFLYFIREPGKLYSFFFLQLFHYTTISFIAILKSCSTIITWYFSSYDEIVSTWSRVRSLEHSEKYKYMLIA